MVEESVALMWAKAMNREVQELDASTSFVDLGGQSLSFAILIDMLEQRFGADYEFFELGMEMTISQIVERVRN